MQKTPFCDGFSTERFTGNLGQRRIWYLYFCQSLIRQSTGTVGRTREEGAELIMGGESITINSVSNYVVPTLFGSVSEGMGLWQEKVSSRDLSLHTFDKYVNTCFYRLNNVDVGSLTKIIDCFLTHF